MLSKDKDRAKEALQVEVDELKRLENILQSPICLLFKLILYITLLESAQAWDRPCIFASAFI